MPAEPLGGVAHVAQDMTMLVVDIVSWMLAAAFLAAGATKLAGLDFHREAFQALGYPQRLRVAVGAVEVAAAGLLLVPSLRLVGAGALVVVTLGAVHAHVFREKAPGHAVPPAVLGALAAVVGASVALGL